MKYPHLLISGDFNVFNEGWNNAGVYMASGNYRSETFKQPIYIGSAIDLQYRIEGQHISSLERNKHPHNPPLQHAWNKHDKIDGFIWWLLEICPKEETLIYEQKYLDIYRPFVDEFGGFNISHNAVSPGARFGSDNGFFGKKHTEETRKKMRENHADFRGEKSALFGKKKSPETIQKHAESLRKSYAEGKIIPHNRGKVFSEEHRRKISESKKGISVSPNTQFKKGLIPHNLQKVKCVETGTIYNSIKEATEANGLGKGTITNYFMRHGKSCGGFRWEKIN